MPLDNRLRILLIEDNEGDAALVGEYVASEGHTWALLRRAKTLREGKQLFAEFDPQVILLDLNLPDSKGEDTIDAFCALEPRPPIVILTSLDDQDMIERAISGCAQDYLIKDEIRNPRRLVRAIRFAVQRHGQDQVDKILREPGTGDGGAREALAILSRVNRTAPGEIADPALGTLGDPRQTSSLLLEHFATGSKATEAIAGAHDQRLRRIEEIVERFSLNAARHEPVWGQLEKVLWGNGRGPLASRLESIETKLVDLAVHLAAHRGRPRLLWTAALVVLALGWFGAAVIAWSIVYFLHAPPGP